MVLRKERKGKERKGKERKGTEYKHCADARMQPKALHTRGGGYKNFNPWIHVAKFLFRPSPTRILTLGPTKRRVLIGVGGACTPGTDYVSSLYVRGVNVLGSRSLTPV